MRARTVLPAALAATLLVLTGCGTGSGAGDDASAVSPPASSPSLPVASATGSDGDTVPSALRFTATTVDGTSFDAESLAGSPTVLWFWAPWCPKCRAQAPATAKVAADYEGTVNVVGVAGLDETGAMKDFVADTGTDGFPQLADENGELWKRFEVTEQSRYVILDKAGRSVYEGVLPAGEGLAEKVAGLTG